MGREQKNRHDRGIFSVTQFSYTFRPGRKSKHSADKTEKYHHALKALAIREHKIHIAGKPELCISGTPVYLDVEGIPDQGFYYHSEGGENAALIDQVSTEAVNLLSVIYAQIYCPKK